MPQPPRLGTRTRHTAAHSRFGQRIARDIAQLGIARSRSDCSSRRRRAAPVGIGIGRCIAPGTVVRCPRARRSGSRPRRGRSPCRIGSRGRRFALSSPCEPSLSPPRRRRSQPRHRHQRRRRQSHSTGIVMVQVTIMSI